MKVETKNQLFEVVWYGRKELGKSRKRRQIHLSTVGASFQQVVVGSHVCVDREPSEMGKGWEDWEAIFGREVHTVVKFLEYIVCQEISN